LTSVFAPLQRPKPEAVVKGRSSKQASSVLE
jgi:hypothetical protein